MSSTLPTGRGSIRMADGARGAATGRHWREDISVADPAAPRLVGGAILAIYLHGGGGRYQMRYLRGETPLAEGTFELEPQAVAASPPNGSGQPGPTDCYGVEVVVPGSSGGSAPTRTIPVIRA